MDPMDYLLHHDSSRPSTHHDTANGPVGSWAVPAHSTSQAFPWPPHHMTIGAAPQPPPLGSHPLPGPGSFFHGRAGGLPPPLSHGRSMPPQDPFMPMRSWNGPLQQMPAPVPTAVAPPPLHLSHSSSNQETSFAAGARGLSFQPPAGPGLVPPGATSDRQSLPPRWLLSPPDAAPNALGQPSLSSHFDLSSQPPPFPPAPPHHHHIHQAHHHHASHPSFANGRRHSRADHPISPFPPIPIASGFTSLPNPSSTQRRPGHTRSRRSMAARLNASDPLGGEHDGSTPRSIQDGSSGHARRNTQSMGNIPLEEVALRQMQVLRGAATIKMVASKKTLQSLESVKVEDLPESERTCVICYNDFGVETPEGINEAPLRLPTCKHVFGDHCIKKWFEDSDSCPYCRNKLHSEPKNQTRTNRTFMNMMRVRGSFPANIPEELFMRVITPASGDPYLVDPMADRRSPPDDADEHQRRTRPRRSGSAPRVPISPSRTSNRRGPYVQPTPSSPGGYASQEAAARQEAMTRLSFWAPQYTPAHRQMTTPSTPQWDQPGSQPGIHPSRYPMPSTGTNQEDFTPTPASGAPVQGAPLPNPLQAHGHASTRDGEFGPIGSQADLGAGASSSANAVRPAVNTASETISHDRHQQW